MDQTLKNTNGQLLRSSDGCCARKRVFLIFDLEQYIITNINIIINSDKLIQNKVVTTFGILCSCRWYFTATWSSSTFDLESSMSTNIRRNHQLTEA